LDNQRRLAASSKNTHLSQKGSTPYIYVGPETNFPLQTVAFGHSFEAGLWGTTKATTFGFVADFLKDGSTLDFWFVKGHLTFWRIVILPIRFMLLQKL
jgi:hypothetical protein